MAMQYNLIVDCSIVFSQVLQVISPMMDVDLTVAVAVAVAVAVHRRDHAVNHHHDAFFLGHGQFRVHV